MERMIGFLVKQITLPSNPYPNLSERAVLQCQMDAIMIQYPQLNRAENNEPQYCENIGDGFIFLRARERYGHLQPGILGAKLREWFIVEETKHSNPIPANWEGPKIRRWARMRLPNGQVGRCAWKETEKPLEKVRQSRMVKITYNGQIEFAEVQFYFFGVINQKSVPLAAVKLFSRPDPTLFEESSFTLWSVTRLDDDEGVVIISAKSILSVVAIIPHEVPGQTAQDKQRFFVWEQFGLEVALWSEALDNPSDAADSPICILMHLPAAVVSERIHPV
ncbi:hypothetical protein CVT24_002802 [Panaeolus cyanescens]|uniref:Uncharacterized protein n=1 Tax=Panaeolus cyanescens TaxID=181874 RepID=A0A409XC44_9AGAR|nr:hypothetical protein CVT24_002802 [Panaeolus cyanescens]